MLITFVNQEVRWPCGSLVEHQTDKLISKCSVVATLALSFLIGSSSFLKVTRTTLISRMSLKFDQVP